MARLPRISPVGIPIHLIQRGHNRQACFTSLKDHAAYVAWLEEYVQKYDVELHAWVLMTNHVHLLCTPRHKGGVSRMMQSLGRRYVHYFNNEHSRTGTLWEGRFKSCLIQEEHYLLEVYRYIELNPVRAGVVYDPGDYRWSSYHSNGLGKESGLCTPHQEYLALGSDPLERQNNYCKFLSDRVSGNFLNDIRINTHKGMAVGEERFKQKLEALTGRRMTSKKRGRPKGWRK